VVERGDGVGGEGAAVFVGRWCRCRVRDRDCRDTTAAMTDGRRRLGTATDRRRVAVRWCGEATGAPLQLRVVGGRGWRVLEIDEKAVDDGDSNSKSESTGEPHGDSRVCCRSIRRS
jgi:hypothetical protein